jgi:hypothetical protein
MNLHAITLRTAGIAGAIAVVAGSIFALGSYSDAKYERALAAARQLEAQAPIRVAIEPARIEVVGTRHAPTRTAAHVDESAPRPQS